MVWGALVGDAAALGAHWIYNLEDLRAKFPEGIGGFEAPAKGHYHDGKRPGDFTHYGDAALILLESLAEMGRLDVADFGERFLKTMAPGAYGGYIDAATRGTVEAYRDWRESRPDEPFDYQQGADDDQMATITSLPPLLALYGRSDGLSERVEELCRARQNNARAIAYCQAHAEILRELLDGTDLHSALHRVEERVAKMPRFGSELRRRFSDAFARKSLSVERATGELGQSCPLLCSFPSALVAAIREPEDYRSCILSVIRAGGDSAGRAAVAGAWLGASLGLGGVPAEWRERLAAAGRIERAVEQLLAAAAKRGIS